MCNGRDSRRWPGERNLAEFPAPRADMQDATLHSARSLGVVRQDAPLVGRSFYRNVLGGFVVQQVATAPVVGRHAYGGVLPMGEQPRVSKPDPWSDAGRGLP